MYDGYVMFPGKDRYFQFYALKCLLFRAMKITKWENCADWVFTFDFIGRCERRKYFIQLFGDNGELGCEGSNL